MENLLIYLGVFIALVLFLFVAIVVRMVFKPIIDTNDVYQAFKTEAIEKTK